MERPAWLLTDKFDSCNNLYRPFILIVSFCVLSSLIIKTRKYYYYYYEKTDVDLGGQPGHVPQIIEKRLCFHQLLPPIATNILVDPNILISLCQCQQLSNLLHHKQF